jgi:large subunit ribosomal protein L13
MRTYSPKPRDIERRWFVIDASGAVLGRLATEAAAILRGKHKPIFAPHMDTGDHVIVVNAKDVTLSGGKRETKVAYRHSGHPGGLTATPYGRLLVEKPAFAVEKAIRGMLPKNRLGRQMASKLKVYAGPDHRHTAQQPQPLKLGEIPTWEGLPSPAVPASDPPAKAATAKRSSSAQAGAKPSTAKRSTATKTAASAKRSTAKRTSTAKSTTAKRSTAKRSAAKPSTAKRSTRKTTKEE